MSASPIPLSLLPDTATVGVDGRLAVGGCALDDLAAERIAVELRPRKVFNSQLRTA